MQKLKTPGRRQAMKTKDITKRTKKKGVMKNEEKKEDKKHDKRQAHFASSTFWSSPEPSKLPLPPQSWW
jgi:hypothetical protein